MYISLNRPATMVGPFRHATRPRNGSRLDFIIPCVKLVNWFQTAVAGGTLRTDRPGIACSTLEACAWYQRARLFPNHNIVDLRRVECDSRKFEASAAPDSGDDQLIGLQ